MSADLLAAFGLSQADPETDGSSSNAKTTPVTRDITISESQGEQPWILQSQPLPKVQRQDKTQPLWKQDSKGANVLFDASEDDQEDEDDFGDFEAAPVKVQTQVQLTPQPFRHEDTDLLGLDGSLKTQNTRKNDLPPAAASFQVADRLEQLHLGQQDRHLSPPKDSWHHTTPSSSRNKDQQKLQPQQALVSADDEWGNFEDAEPEVEYHAAPTTIAKSRPSQSEETEQTTDEDEWDAFNDGAPILADTAPTPVLVPVSVPAPVAPPQPKSTSTPQPTSSTVSTPTPTPTPTPTSTPQPNHPPTRPTNVPPPSNLLRLLPRAYNALSQSSRQPNPPSSLARQTLQIYVTTARLIAGRTHRWKRDTILSQSTRISQAGLKNTGMKLAALDKSETIKEDQEAEEAISAWQRHAATLNAVMLKGKVHKPQMTLSSSIGVRSANGLGVLTARDCCVVCGLKRNERVTGIDVRVEDTFGEFWVEHWGHRDCFDFWYRYEGLLDKR